MIFELSNSESCKKNVVSLPELPCTDPQFRSGQSVYFTYQHKPFHHVFLKPNSFLQ